MTQIDKKYILGETDEEFICVSEEENQQFTTMMIQQTESHLDILSHDFDPDIYDNSDCYEAIEDLALRSRYSRIRILLHNISFISQRGHSILNLGKRLGSLIQFRSVPDLYHHIPDTFMIADKIGVIHRPHTDTIAATVNFKNRPIAKTLLVLFNDIWENSEPDPNTREMII